MLYSSITAVIINSINTQNIKLTWSKIIQKKELRMIVEWKHTQSLIKIILLSQQCWHSLVVINNILKCWTELKKHTQFLNIKIFLESLF